MKCSLTFLIQGSQIYKSNDVSHIFNYSANKYLISNWIKSKSKKQLLNYQQIYVNFNVNVNEKINELNYTSFTNDTFPIALPYMKAVLCHFHK